MAASIAKIVAGEDALINMATVAVSGTDGTDFRRNARDDDKLFATVIPALRFPQDKLGREPVEYEFLISDPGLRRGDEP